MMKCSSGEFSYLAHARLDERRVLQPREPARQQRPCGRQPFRRRQPLHRRRVDDGAARIVRDLEATMLVAGDPVEQARAVLDPDRYLRIAEALSRRRTEEVDLLARSANLRTEEVWKYLTEPRAACEDERVGLDRLTAFDGQRAQGGALRRSGPRIRLNIRAPFCAKRVDHGLTGAAGEQVASPQLQERPADSVERDLRITLRRLGGAQLSERQPRIPQEWHRRALQGVVLRCDEPQRASLGVEALAHRLFVLAPEHERAAREVDVRPVRSVNAADDARLAARARA